MPEVYSAFKDGQFSVEMSRNNPLCRNEVDNTIENTINRDGKTGGQATLVSVRTLLPLRDGS